MSRFPCRSLFAVAALCCTAVPALATTYVVQQTGFTFVPSSITITAGDSILWQWNSGSHTVTSGTPCTPDGMFDSPLNSANPQFTFPFNTPGTYPYFCRPHCAVGMTGTVIVDPLPCQPDATGRTCENTTCPVPGEQCLPVCVNYDPATGAYTILECDCMSVEECHVDLTGVGMGTPCDLPDNGSGTADLPPVGCVYTTPNDDMRIVDGLPLGTTVEIDASMGNFFDIIRNAGGSLGGEVETYKASLMMPMVGTGTLAGFNRNIVLTPNCQTHTAPRMPGDPIQSFPTDMFMVQGQITGDPDFDLLRVTAGTAFGMPSPGHTTLTQLPGGNWAVDSFFDIEYRIDFVGAPGGPLGGMSGSTTATIRFATGLGTPQCVGDCLTPGEVCTRTVTAGPNGTWNICCRCQPTECLPRPDGQGCQQVACPDPAVQQCLPKCANYNPATGASVVIDCDCIGPEECHLQLSGGAGQPCVVPDSGSGTADLPPVGCTYTTPDDDMNIIDGLPPGDTIEIDAAANNFSCDNNIAVCSFPTGGGCVQPGGMLGGQKSCADATLPMPMQGTGSLAGFNRNIVVPISLEIHTAPQSGAPIQSFDTDMFRMFGQVIGDPDFDLLRVVAGTDFGLPSPGHTTLTLLPGGNWAVDSFFDITYRIDFVGAPGGSLAGRSGSTTGTIRFSTGMGTHSCAGICPPGMHCEQTTVVQPDGTLNICCDCVPDPPQECLPDPTGQQCLPVTCPGPGEECLPRCVLVETSGLVTILDCDCRTQNECHVDLIVPDPPCVGDCPPGYTCFRSITPTATGYEVCCDCVPAPTECAPTPDGQACEPYLCPAPPPNEQCQPRCVRFDPQTGQTMVRDCDCRGLDECHPFWQPGTVPFCEGICPPGQVCIENRIVNADGTIDICCDCITPPCRCPGDINGDGFVDGLDIAGFVRCLLGVSLPVDNCACADMNGDGVIDVPNDVPLFIDRLLLCEPCVPSPCPPEDVLIDLTTGVNGLGGFIPVGSDDDNWVVTVDASGGSVPRPATVVTPHPSWLTIPGSQWISANYFGPNGDYTYEFCFCLDERFKFPLLNIQLRADDAADVYLNGNPVGSAPVGSFGMPTPTSITVTNPNWFLIGRNCVTVVVHNIGGPPTGLNMKGFVRADDGKCCCDEEDLDKSIDTGVDDSNGGLIPVGNDDDTWTVTVDPSGGSVPRPATVITPHPAWLTIPGTQWISAAQYGPNGEYRYEFCFCLDPRYSNAQLVIDLRADDAATVCLNGTQVGATPFGWAFNTPLPTHVVVTNPALFRPGENCIVVKVINGGGVVTGLNLAGRITADNGLCCDEQRGACCLPDGTCQVLGEVDCHLMGGVYAGHGTVCLGVQACCLPDGSCTYVDAACCEPLYGGTLLPVGAICLGDLNGNGIDDACELPEMSCCFADGTCLDMAPGVTQCPEGGTLVPGPCGNWQACCFPDGSCMDAFPACCLAMGGTPQGDGSLCATVQCGGEMCMPDPNFPRCLPTGCPIPGPECKPVCVRVDGIGGPVFQVLECDCLGPNDCYVEFAPPPSTGYTCAGGCPPGAFCQETVVDNGDGTFNVCCRCFIP